MRLTYSSVGGGKSRSSYALTLRDLEEIVAAHFGYDPGTVDIRGLELDGFEFNVSGRVCSPAEGEIIDLTAAEDVARSPSGELAEAAIVFLSHLEDTLDDASFDAVSTRLWNRLSSLASEVRDGSRMAPRTGT